MNLCLYFKLQVKMNFTYKLKKPSDGQWGSLKDNGQWTGMVKELHLKEADIGMYDIYFLKRSDSLIDGASCTY